MSTAQRKQELRAELAAARKQFAGNWAALKTDANVPARLGKSVRERKAAWIGGAALIGFIISRLPARKREVLVDAKSRKALASGRKAGLLIAFAKLLVSVLKPAVTAYATKKLADIASSGVGGRRSGAGTDRLPG